MGKKRPAIAALIIAILFVSGIAGTIVYYIGLLNQRDSQITLLNQQIANLTSQNSDLSNQVANLSSTVKSLTSANLVSAINVTEETDNSDLVQAFPNIPVTIVPYYSLWINGSITNTGHVTAINAGLNVTAYASDGTLEINMTVPLVVNAVYGTDNATRSLIFNNPRASVGNDIGSLHFGQIGSFQLGSLAVGQTANVFLAIYHEGIVVNWTATPV